MMAKVPGKRKNIVKKGSIVFLILSTISGGFKAYSDFMEHEKHSQQMEAYFNSYVDKVDCQQKQIDSLLKVNCK